MVNAKASMISHSLIPLEIMKHASYFYMPA